MRLIRSPRQEGLACRLVGVEACGFESCWCGRGDRLWSLDGGGADGAQGVLPQQPGSESGQGLCVPSLPLAGEAGVHSLFCLWFWRQYTAGLRNIWEVLFSVFWGRLIELVSSLFFS